MWLVYKTVISILTQRTRWSMETIIWPLLSPRNLSLWLEEPGQIHRWECWDMLVKNEELQIALFQPTDWSRQICILTRDLYRLSREPILWVRYPSQEYFQMTHPWEKWDTTRHLKMRISWEPLTDWDTVKGILWQPSLLKISTMLALRKH